MQSGLTVGMPACSVGFWNYVWVVAGLTGIKCENESAAVDLQPVGTMPMRIAEIRTRKRK